MNAETVTSEDLAAVKHPFERAGLGLAPFRFVGVVTKVYVSCPGAPAQPGGCCDYCSNGIKYVYNIRSADGKTFGVGSECVRKIERHDNRLVKTIEAAERALKRKQAQAKRAAALPKELARIEAAFAAYAADPSISAEYSTRPHPRITSFRDGTPATFANYVEWMMQNSGHSCRLAIARMIEKQLGNK